jgi:hypothetical protein
VTSTVMFATDGLRLRRTWLPMFRLRSKWRHVPKDDCNMGAFQVLWVQVYYRLLILSRPVIA